MSTELSSQKWQRKFQELDAKVRDKVKDLARVEKERDKLLSQMSRLVVPMAELFKERPVNIKLGRFQTFGAWVEDVITPLANLRERQVYWHLFISKHLMGKVKDEDLDEIGITKAGELAKVVAAKGSVTPELVEQAKKLPLRELKPAVKQLLFKGNPDHADGPWSTIEIRGPQEWVGVIRKFLAVCRRQEGTTVSDAELIGMALHNATEELEEAEANRRKTIRGPVNGSHP